MEMDCLVLGVTRFDGDFQGQRFKNAKIIYIPPNPENAMNKKGLLPITLKGPYELFSKLEDLPGVYKLRVDLKASGKGAVMEVVDVVEKVSDAIISSV